MKVTPPTGRTAAWRRIASLAGDPALPPGATPAPDCCEPGEEPPDRALDEEGGAAVTWESVSGPPEDVNLSDGTVTDGGGALTFSVTPENANDGDLTTNARRGSYAGGALASILETDLGADFLVGTMTVIGGLGGVGTAYSAVDWTVESSPDSSTWTPRSVTYTYGATGARGITAITLDTPATARYWRITYTTTYSGFHANLWVGTWAIDGSSSSEVAWVVPAYEVIDDDDATYTEPPTGTDLIRVDLGAPFAIVRTRIRIATTTSGSRTFTIKAANAADFSDEVTLGTIVFTATGSLTAQDVTGSWANTTDYQYYELSIGTSDDYRVHTWELYEQTPFDPAEFDEHLTDPTDAHNASAIGFDPTGLSVVTGTDVQTAIEELDAASGGGDFLTVNEGGGDVISTIAASGTTETIDLADGNVHDITLTDDCTFTFTSPAAGRGRSFTLFLRQGAGFPHLATWPGSVVWAGGAPTLSTGSAEVDVLNFVTLDGGTVWYGFAAGGGGGGTAATTVEAETTFGITPAVGTDTEYARQDHTHGSPANPFSEAAIEEAGRWEVVVTGTPAEAVTTEDETDWIYAWVTD
jgi:hypothetical protein